MQSSLSCPAPELHLHMTISRVFIREWKARHRHDSATSPDYETNYSVHFSNTVVLNCVFP